MIEHLSNSSIVEDSERKVLDLEDFFNFLPVPQLYVETEKYEDLNEVGRVPSKLLNFASEYLSNNDFVISISFEFEDGGTVSKGGVYHMYSNAEHHFDNGREKESEGDFDAAISCYANAIESEDVYPSIFYETILRMSVILNKTKEHRANVDLLIYAVNRDVAKTTGKDYINILRERLEKIKKKIK